MKYLASPPGSVTCVYVFELEVICYNTRKGENQEMRIEEHNMWTKYFLVHRDVFMIES